MTPSSSRLIKSVLAVAPLLLLAGAFVATITVPADAAHAPSNGTNGQHQSGACCDAYPDLPDGVSATGSFVLASGTGPTSACDDSTAGECTGYTIEIPPQDPTHEGEEDAPAANFIHTVKPVDSCTTILSAVNVRCPGMTYAALAAQNGGKPCCYAGCVIKTPPVPAGTVLYYTC